jgi:hypothetical protein
VSFVWVIPNLPSTQRNEPFAAVEYPTEYGTDSRRSGRTAAKPCQEHARPFRYGILTLLPECRGHCEYVYREFPVDSSFPTTPNPRRGGAALLALAHSDSRFIPLQAALSSLPSSARRGKPADPAGIRRIRELTSANGTQRIRLDNWCEPARCRAQVGSELQMGSHVCASAD